MFAFIWKHSKRDQVVLLLVTLALFPLLYLTLELPKRIINDAIGSAQEQIDVLGTSLSQIEYLMALSGLFLLAVLLHGLLKMRINTMKGVLAERLLRRLRFNLIARMLRFPQPYFERTSQGELVSMVTSESEPMGGLMGDALAQPVLQAGQMLTILGFLFAQSFTFGLAACALIPLQAWLIPRLQRPINLLNRSRVIEVRALAAEIGEGAVGAGTLRIHAGWRYHLARVTDRLGRLFVIRFDIYRKKFFMKFLNNFITQLTPFFFYAIGGYLVIRGDVSLGALVAALAAYKDLSAPWKELLAFYNQTQDMAVRWDTITERFAPSGMVDEALMTGEPETIPALSGDIRLEGVTVRDGDGNNVLEHIDTTFASGALIRITAPRNEDRRALADVLTREVIPASGKVHIGDQPLQEVHQVTLSTRIGKANNRPILFRGTFGDNVLMPIRYRPLDPGSDADFAAEAQRAGNSADMLSANWIDPARGAAADEAALRDTWCALIERIGGSGAMLGRALDQTVDSDAHPELARTVVDLRAKVAERLTERGLDDYVFRLDPDTYCPALPVVQNLLFATPRTPLSADALADRLDYLTLFRDLGLVEDLLDLATSILDVLRQIFGAGGTDHPLFLKTGLDAKLYEAVIGAVETRRTGKPLDERDTALLLSVPSSITAEQAGPAFSQRIKDRILSLRAEHGEALRARMGDMFAPIDPDASLCGLSVMENMLFGKLSNEAGPRGEDVRRAVVEVLREADAARQVLQLIFDVPISLGGANLPPTFSEPLAVSRAVIKRPDIVILDSPMPSFDADTRVAMVQALRTELPEATILYLSPAPEADLACDQTLTLDQGRLVGDGPDTPREDDTGAAPMSQKVQVLERSALFAGLDRKQLRLLAFGAQYYRARAGQYVFHKNDAPDSGAFVMIEGEADLLLPQTEGEDQVIATVGPGTLVGELGLIRNEPRALDMRAKTDIVCLRLGVEEFMAVVENDAATAFKLLQVVAGYVKT